MKDPRTQNDEILSFSDSGLPRIEENSEQVILIKMTSSDSLANGTSLNTGSELLSEVYTK